MKKKKRQLSRDLLVCTHISHGYLINIIIEGGNSAGAHLCVVVSDRKLVFLNCRINRARITVSHRFNLELRHAGLWCSATHVARRIKAHLLMIIETLGAGKGGWSNVITARRRLARREPRRRTSIRVAILRGVSSGRRG